MVADLRRTLREDRSITRFLGTTQLIKGEDARFVSPCRVRV